MKRSGLAAVGSITLSVLVAGCGSAGVSTTPAQSSTPTHGATAQEAGIGDTINLSDTANGDDIAVTVVKVADPDAADDGFSTPPAGDRFVSVQYRIVNTGKGSYQDDPYNEISAKDAAGQTMRQEIAIATTAGAQLPSSMNLAPGDTSLGYVTFDVPGGDKIAQTQYTLNLGFTGTTGEWQIGHAQTQPTASPQSTGPAAPAPPAINARNVNGVIVAADIH